jgi:glycerol-3-phosphate acyltransferase PlsY
MGLWFPSIFIVIPLGLFVLFVIGYASLATLSVAFTAILIFAYRAWTGASPWEYVMYGVLTGAILTYALRPNIRRLLNGTERVVGLRARGKAKDPEQNSMSDSSQPSS